MSTTMTETMAAPGPGIDKHLLHSDKIVLEDLFTDLKQNSDANADRRDAVEHLRNLNDPNSPEFERSTLSMFDEKDVPAWLNSWLLLPYDNAAQKVVRHPTDVVFLTHILWNLCITVPSAIYLFYSFSWLHGIVHALHAAWMAGPTTLMLHNHIHNKGVLAPSWKWLDVSFPYIVEPFIGHTWDTYYYHHIKHHHVEANGPDDLSSTLRFQRDELLDFLRYFGRFFFLIWLELPLYFIRRNQWTLAIKACASELSSYAFICYMTAYVDARASGCALLFPLLFMRIALMVGNWGQHALVDEVEPDHDLRSSITLIDVTSNRLCFNDGYHTSHHMNPRRHWRDQPGHLIQQKKQFAEGKALIFYDIDFFMMTVKLLSKDYVYLANRLVPIGDQVNMSRAEIAEMLRTKTRKFTEEDIREKFKQKGRLTKSS